jgi:hypothetical protein
MRGQVGLQHGLGLFLVGQILAARALKRRDAVLALLDELVHDGDDGGIVQSDALVHLLLLHGGRSRRMVPRRSLSLARMAVFMSSVIWS